MTVDLASGAETGWHSHPIPVYAYVLSGVLDVELEDGQVITYRSGDAIIEVVNTLHNGRSQGPDPVRLAVFYTGVVGIPNVIKPAATSPVTSPPPQ
jgi:quercetin dioxygenase-like cupin family protein